MSSDFFGGRGSDSGELAKRAYEMGLEKVLRIKDQSPPIVQLSLGTP
jgi:hypothetical protein